MGSHVRGKAKESERRTKESAGVTQRKQNKNLKHNVTHSTNLSWIRRLCFGVSWNLLCCIPLPQLSPPIPRPSLKHCLSLLPQAVLWTHHGLEAHISHSSAKLYKHSPILSTMSPKLPPPPTVIKLSNGCSQLGTCSI